MLPDDLIIKIMEDVDYEVLLNMMRASKKFITLSKYVNIKPAKINYTELHKYPERFYKYLDIHVDTPRTFDVNNIKGVNSVVFNSTVTLFNTRYLNTIKSININNVSNAIKISEICDVEHIIANCNNIKFNIPLRNLKSLKLISYKCNLSGFNSGSIEKITVTKVINITGAIFINIKILTIYDASRINDVSMMYNIPNITLYRLPNIDISPLRNAKVLDLYESKIQDISPLSQVKILKLSYCKDITDFSILGQQEELDLSSTNICDVSSLGNVKKLVLYSCRKLYNVQQLTNNEYLDLTGTLILKLPQLGKCELTLSRANITNFDNIQLVSSLCISYVNIPIPKYFPNLHTLNLSSCEFSEFPQMPQIKKIVLRYMEISNIDNLVCDDLTIKFGSITCSSIPLLACKRLTLMVVRMIDPEIYNLNDNLVSFTKYTI